MKKTARSSISTVITLCIVGTLFAAALLAGNVDKTTVDTSRGNAQNIQPTTPQQVNVSMKEAEGVVLDAIPDLPLYPGAIVEDSYVKKDGDLVGYEAEWKTTATATVVAQWFTQILPANGWTITRVPESLATITPPGPLTDVEYMIVATKGNLQVNLIIENEHGGEETEIHAEFPLRRP